MKIQLLLSTMNLKNQKENLELLEKMNVKIDSLTINQITKDAINEQNDLKSKNKLISIKEKGLSKSRNRAIQNSDADICVIADDDVKYVDNFQNIIINEYEKNNQYDIICFFVESQGKRKIKKMMTSKICKLQTMRICSVQITFKRKSIMQNSMKFNENFGAGTYINRGEETIFLWKCIENGLKIKYVNKKIADVDFEKSSWFTGFNEEYFIKQGRVFYELSHKFYKLLILQYAIRKYHLYRKNFGISKAIKLMNSEINTKKLNNIKR